MVESYSNLDDFAAGYSKYPSESLALFRIYCDLLAKKELVEVSVLDGSDFGRAGYILMGKQEKKNTMRVLIPLSMDSHIDVAWLNGFSAYCETKGFECYLSIYSCESIIYQLVTTAMP